MSHIKNQLAKRRNLGNFRTLQVAPPLIDFSSNDYLGLARSQILSAAIDEECSKQDPLQKFGSTGSRLLTGHSDYAQKLEEKIALFHGYESGLLFNCGYMANCGLLSTIAGDQDTIFFDASVHASTKIGIRLSQAQAFPFRHNDLEHLRGRLKNASPKGDRFICIESIYSTDGSRAPLIEIAALAKHYEARLIVDEAHAVGVFGPEGKGLVAEARLCSEVFAQVTTFGKALGVQGAIVMGNTELKEALVNFASSFIYTTALPFYALAAIYCSYELFPKFHQERQHIRHLISLFQTLFFSSSNSPIQPIRRTGNDDVLQLSKKLLHEGLDVRALLSPTVQKGHEVLRICLHSFNTEDEISLLHRVINHE